MYDTHISLSEIENMGLGASQPAHLVYVVFHLLEKNRRVFGGLGWWNLI